MEGGWVDCVWGRRRGVYYCGGSERVRGVIRFFVWVGYPYHCCCE